MLIKKLSINNFRLFSKEEDFVIEDINTPNGKDEGSGITLFLGENGCGKTTILDAFTLPVLSYKADSFALSDFNDPNSDTKVDVFSEALFTVDKTMPKGEFKAQGFRFEGKLRSRGNKSYLSSMVVSDQKFIQADHETKIKDYSPDLRLSVNNPFKGARFKENDFLFLDKNRTYQIRTGTYNDTRFDRLMEDFSFQYVSSNDKQVDLAQKINDQVSGKYENSFFVEAVKLFKSITGYDIQLDLINNWQPFNSAFLVNRTTQNLQVGLDSLGSGYEMFFSLIYSYFLSRQSGKQLIVFIDEPELHLHPALQESFVDFLLSISKDSQIIMTSHSPLLVRHICKNNKVQIKILHRDGSKVELVDMEQRLLPYISASELNYLAFGLISKEYHNELYSHLHFLHGSEGIKKFDNEFFVQKHHEGKNYPWKQEQQNTITLHTYLRNQIHHPENQIKIDMSLLGDSICKMREILSS